MEKTNDKKKQNKNDKDKGRQDEMSKKINK